MSTTKPNPNLSVNTPERGVERGTLAMLASLFRRYPTRSLTVLGALLVASILDGLGISTLLSLMSVAGDDGGVALASNAEEASLPERMIAWVFRSTGLEPSITGLMILGAALVMFKAVVVLLANRQVGYAVAQVATDLRIDLLRAIGESRWRYYLSKSVGTLTNAMATEAQRASEGYLQGAIMATQLTTAFVYVVLALMISWQVTVAALVLATMVLLGLNFLITAAGRAGRRQTGLLKSILSVMTEQLAAIKPLKAMGRDDRFEAVVTVQTRQLNKSLRKQVFSREAIKALQELALALLALVGLVVMLSVLEMPLASAMILIFLLARFVTLLSKAQRAWQLTAISESAYWSLIESIEEARNEREPRIGTLAPSLKQSIRFDQVSFTHPGHRVFQDQSLEIPVGQLTVITGASGSGKTTLIDLIAGLLHPDDGQVLIDGVDLHEIDHHAWRQLIGYVPQEPLLVNESVLYNVTFGDPTLDRKDVEQALAQADALEFVQAMENGLDTVVGERGGRLSGGQRQRLAIARALVQQPKLLILDEATSNLDSLSERAVLATVAHLKGQLTMLAVTHHEPMLELADQVYRIEKGHLQLLGDGVGPAGGAAHG